jgi:hypothetical protein
MGARPHPKNNLPKHGDFHPYSLLIVRSCFCLLLRSSIVFTFNSIARFPVSLLGALLWSGFSTGAHPLVQDVRLLTLSGCNPFVLASDRPAHTDAKED